VPVLVVDLDEAEADKVLATFDPLASMAEPDEAQLEALLKGISTDSEALAELLDQLAKDAQRGKAVEVSEDDVPAPPDEAITKPGDLWILRIGSKAADATIFARWRFEIGSLWRLVWRSSCGRGIPQWLGTR
jgi:hypothetical protein